MAEAYKGTQEVVTTKEVEVVRLTLTVEEAEALRRLLYTGVAYTALRETGLNTVSEALKAAGVEPVHPVGSTIWRSLADTREH